jgi:hypothetical protein
MLIRISGAHDGIAEYLITGRKSGRQAKRDQLDERVVLAGDLELTVKIIESTDRRNERYLHLSFGFKEDKIPESTLRSITEDFKEFAFAAYRTDEYNLYAEAHLPRIKSYINAKTGELVIRKPHIHMCIPLVNLVSGQYLNPLGSVRQQIKFIDAFQEHINAKYGLASPKDHRRVQFTDVSEMLSRYKGDLFPGQRVETRIALLEQVIKRRIETTETFLTLLIEIGDVRIRKGREGDYFNVTNRGSVDQTKGINLKEWVFSREFIELPTDEKIERMQRSVEKTYIEQGISRIDKEATAIALQEWYSLRAAEIRYVNSGAKKFYASYKAADRVGKLAMLAEKASAFDRKYHDGEAANVSERRYRQAGDAGNRSELPPAAPGRVRNASELDVVRFASTEGLGKVQLPSHIPSVMVDATDGADGSARRPDDRVRQARRSIGTGDNVIAQMARDDTKTLQVAARDAAPPAAWQQHLRAAHLLTYLAGSHGIVLDKYESTSDSEGRDSIRCGTRHLSLSNFLTDELHLAWADAEPLLVGAYQSQLDDEHAGIDIITAQIPPPAPDLWREFSDWQGNGWAAEKKQLKKAQRIAEDHRRRNTNQFFEAEASMTDIHALLSPTERRAAKAALRKQRIEWQSVDARLITAERKALTARINTSVTLLYIEWLTHRANATGDVRALDELRRRQQRLSMAAANAIGGEPTASHLWNLARLSYTVDQWGHVTYQRNGIDVLRDEQRRIVVLEMSDEMIEVALRMALDKFRSHLTATGSESFQFRCVEIAQSQNLRVKWSDSELATYANRLADVVNNAAPSAKLLPMRIAEPASAQDREPGDGEDEDIERPR